MFENDFLGIFWIAESETDQNFRFRKIIIFLILDPPSLILRI